MIGRLLHTYKTIHQLVRMQAGNRSRENDLLAMAMMHNLVHAGKYLPFTQFSLSPYALATLMNDIVINRRQHIVEFGAGISTILNARLIRKNGLPTTITSVEHDADWLRIVKDTLVEEDLMKYVTFVEAPLVKSARFNHGLAWYNTDILDASLKGKYDLVLVDGPPTTDKLDRYPALPYMQGRLSDRFSFYLDDANRDSEQAVLRRWEAEQKIPFKVLEHTIALGSKGTMFSSGLRAYL
jgi:hypothetical protein